jgi:hypothetical protein
VSGAGDGGDGDGLAAAVEFGDGVACPVEGGVVTGGGGSAEMVAVVAAGHG